MPPARAWPSHPEQAALRHAAGTHPQPPHLRPDDQVRAAVRAQAMGREQFPTPPGITLGPQHLSLSASQPSPAQSQPPTSVRPVTGPRGRSSAVQNQALASGSSQGLAEIVPEILHQSSQGMPRTPSRSEFSSQEHVPCTHTHMSQTGNAQQLLQSQIKPADDAGGMRGPSRDSCNGNSGSRVVGLATAPRVPCSSGSTSVNAAVAAAHQALFEHQQQRMFGSQGPRFTVQPAAPLTGPSQLRPQEPPQQAPSPLQPIIQAPRQVGQQAPSPLQPQGWTSMQPAQQQRLPMQPGPCIVAESACHVPSPLQPRAPPHQEPVSTVTGDTGPISTPIIPQECATVPAVPASPVGGAQQITASPNTPSYGVRMGRMDSPIKQQNDAASRAQPMQGVPGAAYAASAQLQRQAPAMLPDHSPHQVPSASAQPVQQQGLPMPGAWAPTAAAVPTAHQQSVSRAASTPVHNIQRVPETPAHVASAPSPAGPMSANPQAPGRPTPAPVQAPAAAPSKIAAPQVQPAQHTNAGHAACGLPAAVSAPSRIAAAPAGIAQAVPTAAESTTAAPVKVADPPAWVVRQAVAPLTQTPAPVSSETLQQTVSRIPKPAQVMTRPPAVVEPAMPQAAAAMQAELATSKSDGTLQQNAAWRGSTAAPVPDPLPVIKTMNTGAATAAQPTSMDQKHVLPPPAGSSRASAPAPCYEQAPASQPGTWMPDQQAPSTLPGGLGPAGPKNWLVSGPVAGPSPLQNGLFSGPLPAPMQRHPQQSSAAPFLPVIATHTPHNGHLSEPMAAPMPGRLQLPTSDVATNVITTRPQGAATWDQVTSTGPGGSSLGPNLQPQMHPVAAKVQVSEKLHMELPYMEMARVEDRDDSSSGEIRGPLTPPLDSEPEIWRSPRVSRKGREAPFGEVAGPEQDLPRADSIDACPPEPVPRALQCTRPKSEAPLERSGSNREVKLSLCHVCTL